MFSMSRGVGKGSSVVHSGGDSKDGDVEHFGAAGVGDSSCPFHYCICLMGGTDGVPETRGNGEFCISIFGGTSAVHY